MTNEEEERRRELEDVASLLNTPEGRRFFSRLFSHGRIFQTTHTGNSNSIFLEGHRNLALIFLHDVVEIAPEKLPGLLITAKERA